MATIILGIATILIPSPPGSATLHLPYQIREIRDMNCAFVPFGGGSRVVSLWDMLRFYADKFVEVLNLLNAAENTLQKPRLLLAEQETLSFFSDQVNDLREHLLELNLGVSAKAAFRLYVGLTKTNRDNPEVWALYVTRLSEELRQRVADELEGKAIYYVSDHVELLSDSPLFGDEVDRAFPSAQYDISEAGRCLALRRSTACVVHLMRALEVALENLANELGMSPTTENWHTVLDEIEKEIKSRNKHTHGQKWKDEDEPYFAKAATHFRMIKNAWRNHAMHARDKYTAEEAEEIYGSVRSFMRHLSARLSEEEQYS